MIGAPLALIDAPPALIDATWLPKTRATWQDPPSPYGALMHPCFSLRSILMFM
jgi:hypothetical protein